MDNIDKKVQEALNQETLSNRFKAYVRCRDNKDPLWDEFVDLTNKRKEIKKEIMAKYSC